MQQGCLLCLLCASHSCSTLASDLAPSHTTLQVVPAGEGAAAALPPHQHGRRAVEVQGAPAAPAAAGWLTRWQMLLPHLTACLLACVAVSCTSHDLPPPALNQQRLRPPLALATSTPPHPHVGGSAPHTPAGARCCDVSPSPLSHPSLPPTPHPTRSTTPALPPNHTIPQVVLPHPKKQELDVVVFLDDAQAAPNQEEAEQRVAVAALHRVQVGGWAAWAAAGCLHWCCLQ